MNTIRLVSRVGAGLIFPFKYLMGLMNPFSIMLRNHYADYRQHFFSISLKKSIYFSFLKLKK